MEKKEFIIRPGKGLFTPPDGSSDDDDNDDNDGNG